MLNLPSSLAYPLFHKLAAKGEERVAPGALLQWASAHNLCGVPDARRAFDILRQVRACVCACVCEELCPSQAHRTGQGVSVCVCVAGIGLPVQSWAVIAAGCAPHPLPTHHPAQSPPFPRPHPHMPTCPPLPCLQPSAPYVAPEDLRPLLAGILLSHPGLEFLHEAPEFQER